MKRILILLAAIILGTMAADAQNNLLLPDGTYLYHKQDTCDLFMDVYDPADGSEETYMGLQKPAVIFMFGGGFIRGTRDDES